MKSKKLTKKKRASKTSKRTQIESRTLTRKSIKKKKISPLTRSNAKDIVQI